MTPKADRTDALLWLAGLLLLALVPVGRVSGDGLGYALSFAAGTWRLNPNHLLFEPAGAAWQALLSALGLTRPVVDQEKLLSLLAGAVGAALFRFEVARRLAERRWGANYATAGLVLGSAYLRLLVDDEFHMIQMPCLVGFAIAVLRYLERPRFTRALVAGALAGLAALCFVSNLLLGVLAAVGLGVWHLTRGERGPALRAVAGTLAGLLGVAALGFGAGWGLARPGRPFLAWLLHYSGGNVQARLGLVYGTHFTPDGLASAVVHTLYGAASAVVDLAPAVVAVRDEGEPGRAVPVVLALLLATAALGGGLWNAWRHRGEPEARATLLLQAIGWPAVLGFGIYWNDASAEFFLPLAVLLGALAARLPDRPGRAAVVFGLAGGLALAWNAGDVVTRFVLYPRAEQTAALVRAVDGAGLVVVPGIDDASILLTLAAVPGNRAPAESLGLTDLALALPEERGLERLAAAVERTLAGGRRVDLVDLYDVPPFQFPWKFLRQLGYTPEAVRQTLDRFGVDREPRRAGAFQVRSIRPRR
ncbi:MAG TPA: hypothetical protein VFE33_24160 [Thermoanaerobaculia bacterium]|nr:hypothetical protein [Thermoanaerobaculia bacterium]